MRRFLRYLFELGGIAAEDSDQAVRVTVVIGRSITTAILEPAEGINYYPGIIRCCWTEDRAGYDRRTCCCPLVDPKLPTSKRCPLHPNLTSSQLLFSVVPAGNLPAVVRTASSLKVGFWVAVFWVLGSFGPWVRFRTGATRDCGAVSRAASPLAG